MENQLLNNMLKSSKVMKEDYNNILKDQKSFKLKSYEYYYTISKFCIRVIDYYKANKETIGINQNAFLDTIVYDDLGFKSSMFYDYIRFYNHENKIAVFENMKEKTIKESSFDCSKGINDIKRIVREHTPRTTKGKDGKSKNPFKVVHRFQIIDNNSTDYINILSDGKKYSIKAKINDSFEIIETPENRDQILETLKDELSKIEKYFDKVDMKIKDQMNKQNEKITV